jgi:hypothetical protein
MDREDAPYVVEPDASPAARDDIVPAKLSITAPDVMLIATSWAALASFIFYPGLQLIAFGATILGVAVLSRGGKDA